MTSVASVLKSFTRFCRNTVPFRARRALMLATALACQPATSAPSTEQLPRDGDTYWPAESWRSAAPAQVGLDGARLNSLADRLRSNAIPGLHSLIVVRHGYVALEAYFNGSAGCPGHPLPCVSNT